LRYFRISGWIPRGVDSQKNRSDASDMPRCAPQHTFLAGKEPENNGLGFMLSSVRSPVGPKKLSPPSHTVNRLPLAFRTVWTPIWIPVRTLGSTTASTHGILAKAKGRANPSAHTPHLAFAIAWNCCRCRKKKCCNTFADPTGDGSLPGINIRQMGSPNFACRNLTQIKTNGN
jgi:hypothetical protein